MSRANWFQVDVSILPPTDTDFYHAVASILSMNLTVSEFARTENRALGFALQSLSEQLLKPKDES